TTSIFRVTARYMRNPSVRPDGWRGTFRTFGSTPSGSAVSESRCAASCNSKLTNCPHVEPPPQDRRLPHDCLRTPETRALHGGGGTRAGCGEAREELKTPGGCLPRLNRARASAICGSICSAAWRCG